LYLSAINRWREEGASALEGEDKEIYNALTKKLEDLYERAVVLQYSHMLGIEYDRENLLAAIKEGMDCIDDYSDFCQIRNIEPTFKSPEDDNALLIAARANYLCVQYPETTTLVGLTSGGVELAKVSQLLYRQLYDHDVRTINYPISVHNGLSMWSKDRATPVNQSTIDEVVGLPTVQCENVVICEDNSNSGQTLQRVVNRVSDLGAKKVNFAVVEIDPTRVIMHHVQQKAGRKHAIGEAAEQARPVANYFHPDFIGAVGVVHILPQDQSFTKIIAIDTANRYNGIVITDEA
jgi:hypoxanthine phosphoribosyltransferase